MPDARTAPGDGGVVRGGHELPRRPAGPGLVDDQHTLERRFVTTLYNQPQLVHQYGGRITEGHFVDIDALQVFRHLKGGHPMRSELPFSVKPLHKEDLEGTVHELEEAFYCRRSEQHAERLIEAAKRRDAKRLSELHLTPPTQRESNSVKGAQEIAQDIRDSLLMANGVAVKPISNALAPLNLMFAENTILTIGAPTGTGKSAIGEQIILDLSSQGVMCLDITVELDTMYRAYRYYQHLGGPDFSPEAFMDQRVDTSSLSKVMSGYSYIGRRNGKPVERPLLIEGTAMSLPEVVGEINRFAEEHARYKKDRLDAGLPDPGPPVVMVDFMQQVEVPGEDHVYEQMRKVATTLFQLAKRRGLALIQISQVKKNCEYEMANNPTEFLPDTGQFEGAGAIGHYSHTAMFLWKVKNKNAPTTSSKYDKVKVHMPKVRSGKHRTLEGLLEGGRLNFDFDPISVSAKS